jgi:hypothetical protein
VGIGSGDTGLGGVVAFAARHGPLLAGEDASADLAEFRTGTDSGAAGNDLHALLADASAITVAQRLDVWIGLIAIWRMSRAMELPVSVEAKPTAQVSKNSGEV